MSEVYYPPVDRILPARREKLGPWGEFPGLTKQRQRPPNRLRLSISRLAFICTAGLRLYISKTYLSAYGRLRFPDRGVAAITGLFDDLTGNIERAVQQDIIREVKKTSRIGIA